MGIHQLNRANLMQQQTLISINIEDFLQKFNEKMNLLTDGTIFVGLEDENALEPSTWTMLFNTAIFLTIDEFNKNGVKLSIAPEEPTGRGGYSDVSIFSSDGKFKYFEIEHENSPERILRKRPSIKNNLEKAVCNLSKSSSISKVIITYYSDYYKRKELIEDFQQFKNKWIKFDNKDLFLFLAPWGSTRQFELI